MAFNWALIDDSTGKGVSPGPFSAESFQDYYNGIADTGIQIIINPATSERRLFSAQAIVDNIEYLVRRANVAGQTLTQKQLIAELTQWYVGGRGGSASAAPASVVTGTSIKIPQTKIFTGILSQGTLGEGLTFIPRPDDMIESVAELQEASENNLASFLVSFPSKIVYEIKIVSSVVTRDGFRQTGDTQQVIRAYKSDGTPLYRTVRNKFAVLTLFVLTDRGIRSKIATVILGPTDAAKLNPAQNVLRALEGEIQANILTTDVSEIKTLATSSPVTVQAPSPAPLPPPRIAPPSPEPVGARKSYVIPNDIIPLIPTIPKGKKLRWAGAYYHIEGNQLIRESDNATATIPSTAAPAALEKKGQSAQTLFEWYQANGQSLPSVSARSQIYAGFGLGSASMYAGTAEQNTRLLAALKNT